MNTLKRTLFIGFISLLSITTTTFAQGQYRGGLKTSASTQKKLPVQSEAYALIVATDEYDNFEDLNNPIFDGKGVAEVLKNDYDFHVELLLSPTKEELLDAVRGYHSKLRKNDRFLLYLAGHGDYEDKYYEEGFLILKNTKSRGMDPSLISYLPFHRLKSLTENLPSQQALVVVDVCFGGSFNDKINKGRGAYNNQYSITAEDFLRFQLEEKNRYVLSSGRLTAVADGRKGEHSPFAGALIHSLKEHKADSIVTAETLKYDLKTLPSHPILGSFSESVGNTEFVFKSKSEGTSTSTLMERAIDQYMTYQMNLSKYKLEEPFVRKSKELATIAGIFDDAAVIDENIEGMFWKLLMENQHDQIEMTDSERDYYAKQVVTAFQKEQQEGINTHLWQLATIQALGIRNFADDEEIYTLFRRAMGQHSLKSFYFGGKYALRKGDKNKAYTFFKQGAKENDPFCLYELGKLKYENLDTYELDRSLEGYRTDLEKASDSGLQRATDLLLTID
ncbi:caspase family protein [Flammeovirga sp. OC4]|uniref:caspase family protein n=1 Tax=Flammeovirga sp. OC4 TaxID=1382345 RepID=UPI0005C5E91E|nr:caspase family protein [Flammeovirga sp. OC4]